MAFVLAAEVRSVVVTDLKACLGRVETFGEHEPPRLLQAEFLLKLDPLSCPKPQDGGIAPMAYPVRKLQ